MDDIPDWLLHLETLVQIFELKGLEYERVSVLNLLMRVHEMACPLQPTSLISTISLLGSQYARLGYPSQAGFVLQRGTYSTKRSYSSTFFRPRNLVKECLCPVVGTSNLGKGLNEMTLASYGIYLCIAHCSASQATCLKSSRFGLISYQSAIC